MIKAIGIDIGSTTAKIVGVNESGDFVWSYIEPADPRVEDQVERFLEKVREVAGSI